MHGGGEVCRTHSGQPIVAAPCIGDVRLWSTAVAKLRMTRIDPPEWATQPDLRIGGVTVAEYSKLQNHRVKMLRAVNLEVEAYLNDPRLVFDGDEEGFPHRKRLSGDYYIGGESYTAYRDPVWFAVCVRCRCLARQTIDVDTLDDYLGLGIWLKCEPGKWATFEVFRNTDSSVI